MTTHQRFWYQPSSLATNSNKRKNICKQKNTVQLTSTPKLNSVKPKHLSKDQCYGMHEKTILAALNQKDSKFATTHGHERTKMERTKLNQ